MAKPAHWEIICCEQLGGVATRGQQMALSVAPAPSEGGDEPDIRGEPEGQAEHW